MRSARFGVLILSFFLFSGLQARQIELTTTWDSNPAIVLLKSSLSAQMGSAAVIPNSFVASGNLAHVSAVNPAPYPVRIYVLETDKLRWEEELPEGILATVINGEKAQSQ